MGDEPRQRQSGFSPGSTSYVALQIALLVIGVIAFVQLINIVALNGDIFPDFAELLEYLTWVILTLSIIFVVLLGEILLFFFQQR